MEPEKNLIDTCDKEEKEEIDEVGVKPVFS
jgi:hypothetical protein